MPLGRYDEVIILSFLFHLHHRNIRSTYDNDLHPVKSKTCFPCQMSGDFGILFIVHTPLLQ